jgi:methionyl aminopeptidase
MIICKSPAEIEKLRRSGRIARGILEELRDRAKPGVMTLELEQYVVRRLAALKAKSAFKGYRGYPCCLCASVNDQVIHGIPSQRRLKEGDILGLDLGVIVDGYVGDSAITVAVGEIAEPLQKLMAVGEEALELAIEQARVGNRVGDISAAIQRHAETHGCSVVREFVGHGIGRDLHEEPQVPNFGTPGHGPALKVGMVLAIETMINSGGPGVRVLDDRWTAVTEDGGYSVHFEHMVAISRNGPDVLTRG